MFSKENSNVEIKKMLLVEVYDNIVYAMAVTDSKNNILFTNSAFSKLTGYGEEEVIGKNPSILSSGMHGKDFYLEMWHSIRKKGLWKGEIWNKRKDGKLFLEEITISAIKDVYGNVKNYVSFFIDITERKKLEEKLKFQALYDDLTKLPNRTFFNNQLNQTIQRAVDSNNRCAVIFLDLDRFKDVNDSLGHSIGDELLKATAIRLKEILENKGIVTRYGGDEFAIILHDLKSNFDCIYIVNRIIKSFSKPFILNEFELFITPSIGISIYPNDGEDGESLVKFADSAMYYAKQDGKNTYKFYQKDYMQKSTERLMLTNDLRKAIENNEFLLYYQPKISCNTGELDGVEALIRWRHPKKGMISPDFFISLAEETGLIVHIDQWVMRQACLQIKEWQEKGYKPVKIAVNLSMLQFQQKNLVKIIKSILQETGIHPSNLEIELTERVIMNNPDVALPNIKKLKSLGIQISMDDFGTHYSSLNYLKLLSLNSLKIDQSFIRDLLIDKHDQSIVKAMIQLAHNLDLKVVAEGVETKEQFQFLKSQQCDYVQGFYFDQPLPPAKILKYIS
ncbi:MAG TPA: EAL domain-containing protein [Bacillus bacterium]|nr:EAL domain-containing protein [Bacillus sp. (in: firmicutes)]